MKNCAVSHSYGIKDCKGVYNCAFCFQKDGIAHEIFNKKTTEERAAEIVNRLEGYKHRYYSDLQNLIDLDNDRNFLGCISGKDFEAAEKIILVDMLSYIKSLPEYDEKIFKSLVGNKDLLQALLSFGSKSNTFGLGDQNCMKWCQLSRLDDRTNTK